MTGANPASGSPAVVGVVMGSDSDWPVMKAAAEALEEFGVAYEADVVSAHRMPRDMIEYGSSAEGRGLRVIIAGAGGAAHLPGMLASVTTLPVIGVPVPLANLSGLDSLLSIVQMPAGIPVATVAVGGARNAGLLAVRILAASDGPDGLELRARLAAFAEGLAEPARAKGAALRARRRRLRLLRVPAERACSLPAVDERCQPAREAGVSIGATLAAARRRAGLSIGELSAAHPHQGKHPPGHRAGRLRGLRRRLLRPRPHPRLRHRGRRRPPAADRRVRLHLAVGQGDHRGRGVLTRDAHQDP